MFDLFNLAAIGIVCGVVAGLIYNGKGRSGVTGFLCGLLLGPWGILLVLLLPASEGVIEARLLRRGEVQQCPDCAEMVRPTAAVCRYCGRDLNEQHEE